MVIALSKHLGWLLCYCYGRVFGIMLMVAFCVG